jgi:ABC-type amino acid transport substrate-binding protein
MRARRNKNMAKMITIGLVVIMLIVGFAVGLVSSPFIVAQNSSTADTVWSNIEKTGVITVGTDPSWPPYEQLDNSTNKIVGFEVDLTNAVAAQLNLTVDWQSVSFDNIITSVQQNKLDMGVSGFSVTPDRLAQVSFTMPHSTTRAQVIMLQSKIDSLAITNITSLHDLKNLGLTVGTQDGTTEQQELQAAGVSIRSWNDFASAIQDMASANPSVQAVYAETPITTAWIAQYQTQGTNIGIVYDHAYYPCAFVVNKNANTFLDKFNGAMAQVIQSGQLDQLRAKWHA